jgi:hypothetical protein
LSETIRLQFSATADDVGTVQHKQLAFAAMAEALLTWRPLIDHLATLRKSKGFAHARAHVARDRMEKKKTQWNRS